MKRSKIKYYCLVYSASFIFLVVFVGPFLWLVSSSLQLERQIIQVPPVWYPHPINIESNKDLKTSVSVALRPEKIRIETIDNNNSIHATINNASFVGNSYQYILNSNVGKLYVVSADTNNVFKVGEEVFLSLDEKDVKVLND